MYVIACLLEIFNTSGQKEFLCLNPNNLGKTNDYVYDFHTLVEHINPQPFVEDIVFNSFILILTLSVIHYGECSQRSHKDGETLGILWWAFFLVRTKVEPTSGGYLIIINGISGIQTRVQTSLVALVTPFNNHSFIFCCSIHYVYKSDDLTKRNIQVTQRCSLLNNAHLNPNLNHVTDLLLRNVCLPAMWRFSKIRSKTWAATDNVYNVKSSGKPERRQDLLWAVPKTRLFSVHGMSRSSLLVRWHFM